ncbi:hypothetical protein S7711_07775 [Stachybotrys chartarum IBT 7711]|uniref:Uncharacterized protein n=1 Tax=Stachybotrys chartarum (strain CBS 109288 / IBT 7711) TaxID=1280523 RepID=A0A084B8Q6_STACB|nr:hypothetical protein S7711_07775 [Stachybotrys chartarum IBT 7711]
MVNLTDNSGEAIFSNPGDWYKITLADGKELGLGAPHPSSANNGRTLVEVVPAGSGMVFRYQRKDGDDRQHQGWPIGDKGYLRGIQVLPDGSQVVKNLSLSWEPVKLCLYDNYDNYGMVATQLPGNRVALYGYNRHGGVCGLRVTPNGNVIAHEAPYPLPLDCEFVKVNGGRYVVGQW